jgi:hypothetical protein
MNKIKIKKKRQLCEGKKKDSITKKKKKKKRIDNVL